ncbi:endonuclease domain-containing protein [Erythrobacter sp. NFXS35]|uniref:endonuclease domain-containing protein n=1 Tax=Erythrobacter sp. NFXS35 TaxID=2818436 RepID=UPI0032DE7FFC
MGHNYAAARVLRKAPTLPEGLLWRELRAKRSGLKFRRQHPVGRHVIDLYCAAAKCGIEIDGIAHDMGVRPEADRERDAFLTAQGNTITRIPAREVLVKPAVVAEQIVALCKGIIEGLV